MCNIFGQRQCAINSERQITKFLGLDLLFLKDLLALLFTAVNSEWIRHCNPFQKINLVFVFYTLQKYFTLCKNRQHLSIAIGQMHCTFGQMQRLTKNALVITGDVKR